MDRKRTAEMEALAAAQSRTELLHAFRAVVAPLTVNAFAIGFLPGGTFKMPRDPFLLLDWPREWLELYARMGFAADDVVVEEAQRTREPFTWLEIRRRHPGASAAIFAAAESFGWRDGFVVPVHDVRGRPGVASLAATGRLDLDETSRRRLAGQASFAFQRARSLQRAETRDSTVRLTDREREVLTLVAQGRSDMQIGEILKIKAATAHFHIEQAKRRLGATTRAQAVALAVRQSLV